MSGQVGASRRQFLGSSGVGAAALAGGFVPAFASTSKALANAAANDRPRIGCIGTGSMGTGDAQQHAGFGDILAVCDVDNRHAERAREDGNIGKGKADAYRDYRKVLDRNDIDVVSIVTTDHWHVKIAIEALQAGKHVFCQKPLSLTLEENQLCRNAAEKFPKQVFFIGTQQRSQKDQFLRAVNMVHKGLLGPIKKVTVGINGAPTGGPFPVAEVPKELDWEMWQGQATAVPFREKRCHYEFRWWYEYSGGKFTDWGAHHVDIAQWALQEDSKGKGPTSIDGTDVKHPVPYKDGYATVDDSYNTAHDFAVVCKFPSGVEMVIDSRSDNGILFEGEKGRMFVNREKCTGKPIEDLKTNPLPEDALVKLYKGKKPGSHMGNFFECLRSREQPISDVFTHHRAMTTCHLANIAIRLGRKLEWDPVTEHILNDQDAAQWEAREQRKGFEIVV